MSNTQLLTIAHQWISLLYQLNYEPLQHHYLVLIKTENKTETSIVYYISTSQLDC